MARHEHFGGDARLIYHSLVILTISEDHRIMTSVAGTAEVKARLSEFVSRILARGDRVIVARRGRPVAALVGLDDLRRLEAMDARRATDAYSERHPVMAAFGAWSDADDWDKVMTEIYAERTAALATHNRKHFDRIPGLRIMDWLSSPTPVPTDE